MSRKPTALILKDGDQEYLLKLIKQRTIRAQIVIRAHILLDKANEIPIRDIARIYDISPNTVRLCINKYKDGGVDRALYDDHRKGRPVEITDDAIAWIINIACQRPAELGYSQELWTIKNLHQHLQKSAEAAGYPRLKTVTQSMIQKILKRANIKPFKIKYYCEKRDPDFENKIIVFWLFTSKFLCSLTRMAKLLFRKTGIWYIQFHAMKKRAYKQLIQQVTICDQIAATVACIVIMNTSVSEHCH